MRRDFPEYAPLTWNNEDFQGNRFFWEEALHHGTRHGWSILARSKYGLIGTLSLIRSNRGVVAVEIPKKEPFPSWVTDMLQATFGDLLAPRIVLKNNAHLTARETEMLKRTVVGKIYDETGLTLSINQCTVKSHIVGAMHKLNPSSKAEATMKAYVIGLLN